MGAGTDFAVRQAMYALISIRFALQRLIQRCPSLLCPVILHIKKAEAPRNGTVPGLKSNAVPLSSLGNLHIIGIIK
ncbi:hypothetical protein D3C80_1478120 [compost metagenome]